MLTCDNCFTYCSLSFILCIPLSHIPTLEAHRTGATGKVMAGAEIKIDTPGPNGDGEICFRGRHVFMGYLKEERKTREVIDEDGWLHSGDIGRLDKDGVYALASIFYM